MEPLPLWGLESDTRYFLEGACVADGFIWALLFDNTDNDLHLYRYTPATDSWTAMLTQAGWNSDPRDICGLVPVGRKLYIYGKGKHWSYDIATNTWDTTSLSIPASQFWFAGSAVVGHTIYYIGGNPDGDTVSSYDVDSEVWDEDIEVIPETYGFWSAVALDGKVYWKRDDPAGQGNQPERYEFDPVLGFATTTPDMPHSDRNGRAGMGTDGARLWSVGGFYQTASDATEDCYYLSGGTWVQIADHPQAQGTRTIHILHLGGFMWTVGGGFDVNRFTSSLCRYTPAIALHEDAEGFGVIEGR